MVRLIMALVGNRSFALTTTIGKRSRLPRLKNGVPQGSILAPFFFNIYSSDFLAGIQPAGFRRNGATLSLARRAMEPGYLFHSALTCPSSGNARHLKSRHPYIPATQQLIISSDDNSRSAALWSDH